MTDTPFPNQRATISEEWHDCFDTLTAQGRAPSSILATIKYVTTPRTQPDVGDEYNVSPATIRNLQAEVVALAPEDERTARGRASMTMLDYCTHIADTLGWEENREYAVGTANDRDTPQPYLLNAGWHALYTELCTDDPDA